jgi:tRNA(Ile)-lysidine synthase
VSKIIAYSGGVDSHVLLHQLSQKKDQTILAVHVNHGLHVDADKWQTHCQKVCEDLGVAFKAIKVDIVKKPRHSLEALAREARYAALQSLMSESSVLLTGHNQNDQAETVLLQLMRGAGVKGLSGMSIEKPFGCGIHYRPLLDTTRDEIMAYAQAHKLTWVEDPSNIQNDFDRNFLRNKIIPELVTRREGVIRNIARASYLAAETVELTEALAEIDYQNVKGPEVHLLSIDALKALSDARQNNVLRYWLSLQNIRMPSQAILRQAKQQLLHSYLGADPVVRWGHVELKRSQKDIQNKRFLSICNI